MGRPQHDVTFTAGEVLADYLNIAAAEGIAANVDRFLGFRGVQPGEVVELQALKVPNGVRYTVNKFAHAISVEQLVHLAEEADKWKALGVYFVANVVNPAIAARGQIGRWNVAEKGESTVDADVTHRRVLYIDVDYRRPRGIGATEAEVAAVLEVAARVHDALAATIGEEAIGVGFSGNGANIFVALDNLPESPELAALVKGILAAISASFTAGSVEIDVSVCEAKRLCPAFGTTKRKGQNVTDRPHRPTGFMCAPTVRRLGAADLRLLLTTLRAGLSADACAEVDKAMGVKAPPKTRASAPRADGRRDAFALANAVDVKSIAERLGLIDGDDVRCPGCGSSGDSSVALVGNGLKCLHASCANKGKPAGFRSPVDLVAEVKGLAPLEAARTICEWEGIDLAADDVDQAGESKRYTKDEINERRASRRPKKDKPISTNNAGTDAANAADFAHDHAALLRYAADMQKWLNYDGRRWMHAHEGILLRAGKETAQRKLQAAAAIDNEDARKAAVGNALSLHGVHRILNMVRMAAAEPAMELDAAKLDADPLLLNVENGTIDLRTGQLRPHSRADLITRLVPIRCDPAASAPRWNEFMSQVFGGDDDLIAFVRRAVGYSLTGDTTEHALFLLWGTGCNGKSVFVEILRALLGEFSMTAPMTTFSGARDRSAPTNDLAMLRGARVVTVQESEEGAKFCESLVKQLTGGDAVTARFLNKEFFTFVPAFKPWLATNYKPRVRDGGDSFWRRVKCIPFGVSFLGREDKRLLSTLRAELPGILNWALRGCLEWQASGLGEAEAVRAATAGYRAENDTIAAFIADRLVVRSDATISSKKLYRGLYLAWCEENDEKPAKQRAVSAAVLRLSGVTPYRDKLERGFCGVGEIGDA